jgi:hypothetical protein
MKKIAALALVSMMVFGTVASASQITTDTKNASHYRLLSEPNSLRMIDIMKKPQGFHVKAVSTGTGVSWSAKVEGRGKLCTGQDMLDLDNGNIYKAGSEGKPVGPYVVGCAASNGVFTPSSLDVMAP